MAKRQGTSPETVSAAAGIPGDPLAAAELAPTMEAVDRYLSLDTAAGAAAGGAAEPAPSHPPYHVREEGWEIPRPMRTDQLLLQMLDAATR